jgi:O-antigen ligase
MKGLILVYLLTAIGMIGAFRAPKIGLYVYILFAVLRPHYMFGWAGGMAGLSQAVGIAMLVGWVMAGLGKWRLGNGRQIVAAFLLFLLWSLVSSFQAIEPSIAWDTMNEMSKILLPFVVGVTVLESERDIRRMLWIIVIVQAYISFEMNLAYLQGYNRAHEEGYGGMDNNCFGLTLVTAFGATIGLLFGSKGLVARAVACAAGLMILHTIQLTFSRGALLGLLVAGTVAVIIMPKRPRYVLAAAAVLLITIRLTGPELAARYETTFAETENRDESAAGRLELWADCLTVIASEPFLGVGPRNWPVIAEQFGWARGKEAHSVWVQTAAEIGVPGVLALLAFYLMTMFKLWRVVKRRTTGVMTFRQASAFGILLALSAYVVSAQFVSLTGLELPFYLVMVAVALLRLPEDGPVVAPTVDARLVAPRTQIALPARA